MKGLIDDLRGKCVEMGKWSENYCLDEIYKTLTSEFQHTEEYLDKLARSKRDALLWAGFWEGDGTEEGRTSLRALQNFANMVDHETVHPSTELGRIVRKNGMETCRLAIAQRILLPPSRAPDGSMTPAFSGASGHQRAKLLSEAWQTRTSVPSQP
ncbi:hypothetical protein AK812_SmicGene49140 [Symbiodinium microadriaticum]|uniref:Uncharacterized protein n=1 Tax=Symbiodinium microadriaticum TaxID=2951 RepID=A0A1Q9E5U9_SYMMI|nr:hypothetical protein AK812_SmicGene49140 [Symbiodinium microadriaticum]